MRLKLYRILLPALFTAGLHFQGLPQENSAFRQPGLDYRLADDMYRSKNTGAARQLYHEISGDITIDDPEIITGANFREAASAAELKNGDAPERIENFIETYPENALSDQASLYLGKIYFKDNKYKDALKAFQRVDVPGLSKSDREELYFMMGYSQLKTGDPAAAKAYFQRVSNQKSVYYGQAKYFLAHIDYTQGNYKEALKGFEEIENDRRYEKIIPLYKIQIYNYLGDDEKIMAIGPSLVESAGNNNKAEVARITGNAFFNAGDYENASLYLHIFEQANRKSMTRDDHYLLGFVDYKAGKYEDAIGNFQKAVKQNDTLSQIASYYLGACYNETGQKKYAGNAFLAAYKNGIDKGLAEESLFNYIKISLETPGNPYNESISLLETYLKEHPGSPRTDEGYDYLSRLYLSSRNYKQALVSMEAVSNKKPQMQAAYQEILFNRAAELFNMQDPDGSMELYEKASKIASSELIRAESLYWMGEIFYLKGNYWAAIKYYKDFLNSKQATKSALYPNAQYNLGYTYFNREEYTEAIAQFTKFIETSKSTDIKLIADAYLRLGDAYFISKQYDKAIASYDKVILSKEPTMDYALYYKALSEGAKGDFNRKVDILKVLINNYPKSAYIDEAYYETALAYMLLNEENQALVYFDKLIQTWPASAKAIQSALRKGFIYFNRNDYNLAISSFKTVIEKYPGTQESQEALAALKNIYIETGEVDQYYSYAKGLSFAVVNTSEEDSLSFDVAENYYMQGRCEQAVKSFSKYLEGFPDGAFASSALYYQSDCYLKSNQLPLALEGFKKVAEKPRSKFTEPALATASSMEYSSGNYTAALPLFEQLETVAEDPDNIMAAITGQMRCHYRTASYPSAILAAQKLVSTGKASADLANETHFILGKSYLAQNDLTLAEQEFTMTGKLKGTENGAEATYNLAEIAFQTNRLNEAEERIYSLSENFAAYDYWVAKGFILLSDIFLKNGNEFQARETLQSVIDNYEGPELGETARQKLNTISNEQ
jgi:TolA-binding protein